MGLKWKPKWRSLAENKRPGILAIDRPAAAHKTAGKAVYGEEVKWDGERKDCLD